MDARAKAREMAEAAEAMDWQQVVQNGGPPCFSLDWKGPNVMFGAPRFCGRAERWGGHHDKSGKYEYPHHRFVSLADLLEKARG